MPLPILSPNPLNESWQLHLRNKRLAALRTAGPHTGKRHHREQHHHFRSPFPHRLATAQTHDPQACEHATARPRDRRPFAPVRATGARGVPTVESRCASAPASLHPTGRVGNRDLVSRFAMTCVGLAPAACELITTASVGLRRAGASASFATAFRHLDKFSLWRHWIRTSGVGKYWCGRWAGRAVSEGGLVVH